ncbi:MAG: chloride channel protein [Myxococcota bacterium]|nr:chloride channel protein [Myxococcota bacterium]
MDAPHADAARRPPVYEHSFLALVAVACGLAGAAGAILFRSLIYFFGELFFGSGAGWMESLGDAIGLALDPAQLEPAAPGADLPWWRRLIAPAIGGAIVGPLVHYLAVETKGHGVPEVMLAVARGGGVIRRRVVSVKTLASAITIGSGGSVGREGPIVQIGAALGSAIGQTLKLPARQIRTLVGCGAAAGIAATFNAPIAGALFAVEVILGDFAAAQLAPIVISSVVATVVSRAVLGDNPAFLVPAYELVSPLELGFYAIAGVLAGLVGLAFVWVLYATEDGFDRWRFPEPAKAAVGGLLVGAIGSQLPEVFGGGYGAITAALAGELTLATLGLLLVAKLAATSITLGSGGSGGVFAPSLFIGAVGGGLFGGVVHGAFPAWTASSGAYALVTMGAVVAATTHAPITAIIMIFEMTQSIAIIPPLMITCVVSMTVAALLRRDSIYTLKLRRRGIDLQAEQDPNVLRSLFVRDVIDREPEIIPADAPFGDVLELVVGSRHTAFFVADGGGELLGAISVHELRRVILEEDSLRNVVVAADLIEESRPTLHEDDTLDLGLQLLSRSGATELAVVAQGTRRIVGALHEQDVLAAFHAQMLSRDLAGSLGTRLSMAQRGRTIELGSGYVLAEVEAPAGFAGRSLRQLDLRGRLGVQVVLLRDADREAVRVPDADECIAAGDRMVVAGPQAGVAQLSNLGH